MTGKVWKATVVLVLALLLTACANDNNNKQGAGRNGGMIETQNWGNPRNTNYSSMHNNTTMNMDERIAKSIAAMAQVDQAYVLLTDKNAYIAVKLKDGAGEDTGNNEVYMKEQIAAKVKQMAPRVKDVFISANPDFVTRLRGYSDRFNAGQPIRGMILEFNRAVERLFPNRID